MPATSSPSSLSRPFLPPPSRENEPARIQQKILHFGLNMLGRMYYGPLGREDTERMLEKYGKDGSFLLRDSQSVRGALCLCVRKTPFVHTYRIQHSSQGWAVETINRERPQWFQSLDELLECYRNQTPHDMVPLLYPLEKTHLSEADRQYTAQLAYMEMSGPAVTLGEGVYV